MEQGRMVPAAGDRAAPWPRSRWSRRTAGDHALAAIRKGHKFGRRHSQGSVRSRHEHFWGTSRCLAISIRGFAGKKALPREPVGIQWIFFTGIHVRAGCCSECVGNGVRMTLSPSRDRSAANGSICPVVRLDLPSDSRVPASSYPHRGTGAGILHN